MADLLANVILFGPPAVWLLVLFWPDDPAVARTARFFVAEFRQSFRALVRDTRALLQ
jgi:hypothetical protein